MQGFCQRTSFFVTKDGRGSGKWLCININIEETGSVFPRNIGIFDHFIVNFNFLWSKATY